MKSWIRKEDCEYREKILGVLEKSNLSVDEVNKIELWLNAVIENNEFFKILEINGIEDWDKFDIAMSMFRDM